jgi:Na+-driven multidrug efflux pump
MFEQIYGVSVWFFNAVGYSIGAYDNFKNRKVIKAIIMFCFAVLSIVLLIVAYIPKLIEKFEESKKKKECK